MSFPDPILTPRVSTIPRKTSTKAKKKDPKPKKKDSKTKKSDPKLKKKDSKAKKSDKKPKKKVSKAKKTDPKPKKKVSKATKNSKKPKKSQGVVTRSPELREVAEQLSSLALVRVEQNGALSVRQREQLRRALAAAGDALGWNATAASTKDPVSELSKDVRKLVRTGAQQLKRVAATELANKHNEIAELEDVSASIRELAETDDTTYPLDLSYTHTARDAARGLVTKVATVTVNDAQEAQSAADTVDKGLSRWGQLRDQMLVELDAKQERLAVVTRDLSEFVDSTRGLLKEVIATLH